MAPVVIPALAPTLDKSLRSDRFICPVRALRYYLDRTSDLRQNKELVCLVQERLQQGHLTCHHLLDQTTVILCYELSDQESFTLHQAKAPDVSAFAASMALQSGVSLNKYYQPATGDLTTPSLNSI